MNWISICYPFKWIINSKITRIHFVFLDQIISNYLFEFEIIWTGNCEISFIWLIWPDKRLDKLIFIWSSESHKWSLTIIFPNSLKLQVIWENPNLFFYFFLLLFFLFFFFLCRTAWKILLTKKVACY
jgi:hypothetical protein